MMKALLTVCFMILFLSSVKANMCVAQLVDTLDNNETHATFIGQMETAHGCEDAMDKCEDYLQWEVKFKKGMLCIDAYGNTNSGTTMDMELGLDQYAL